MRGGGRGQEGRGRLTKAQKSLAMYNPSVRRHNPLLLPMDSRSFKQREPKSGVLPEANCQKRKEWPLELQFLTLF